MCPQSRSADRTFGPGLWGCASVPCTPSGGHHVNAMGGKCNTTHFAEQRFRGGQQPRGSGYFRSPKADRDQTFGPVDCLLARQVASDNADKLLFAHDKCQSGMLVGIRHGVS
ncbi:hypothetical protein [Acetobacter ascendens]|uniref:hypothetical protein n=1 Tax=Acetobacter ascendens TaxID=481146 RepID=UPI00138FAC39|nr:hypothetical protein [Acetobacter ascendens]